MEIQQDDGVVVEVAGFQQGFAKRCGRRKVCHGREREAPGLRLCCPPFPPLYIGPRERGRAQPCPFLQGRVRPRGGGVHPPQGTSEVPSPFRTLPFPLLLAHGPLGAGALGPYRPRRTPYSPCGPPGAGGPPWWTPGPLSALPVQYR